MTKSSKAEFRPNDYVVYPAHGVGQIVSIEKQEIAGIELELFVISFEKIFCSCHGVKLAKGGLQNVLQLPIRPGKKYKFHGFKMGSLRFNWSVHPI